MSITSEITRIKNAKTAMATSITNKGVTVPETTKIDGYSALIDSIPSGGGTLQSKTVTPSETAKNVTPDEGYYGLSEVMVEPIPSGYKDVSGIYIDSMCVLQGIKYIDRTGEHTGSMTDIGALDININGEVSRISIGAGFTGGGSISFTAPFNGVIYPWKTIDDLTITDRQFASGAGITGIKTLMLPNVETIGSAAFLLATGLEVIDIGASATSIHFSAFNSCSKLRKLIFRGLWLPTDRKLALSGTPILNYDGGYIYVPDSYLEQYKTATYWADWAERIKPISEL